MNFFFERRNICTVSYVPQHGKSMQYYAYHNVIAKLNHAKT